MFAENEKCQYFFATVCCFQRIFVRCPLKEVLQQLCVFVFSQKPSTGIAGIQLLLALFVRQSLIRFCVSLAESVAYHFKP